MKTLWMLAATAGVVLLVGPVGRADHRDDVRGLLYRVDAEAHTLRLHPSEPGEEAAAVQRQASKAADALQADGLVAESWALRRESWALMRAAQRRNPVDVQQHAANVEVLVRQADDALLGQVAP
jgi:hypothetical protein